MAERFVCVRIQSMNGVNLNQFPFEYDLTWMAFFQNADGRTYTRYGGREDHDAESHLNKAGLLRAMQQVLRLHDEGAVQPDNRYEPVAASLRTPEDIPPMQQMLAKRKVRCIHCHDVKGATLRHLRDLGRLEKDMVFTYPSPSRLGIHLDPQNQSSVQIVDADSPAATAGIQPGDVIRTIDNQRVLTFADATRVLELAPETGTLDFALARGDRNISATLELPPGWRRNADPSWRPTTGVVGPSSGFWGARAKKRQRDQLGLGPDALALRVTYIWAPWARAAGVENGDVIVSVDGYKKDMTIRQLQAYLQLNRNWGDKISVVVRRNGKQKKLTFQFPQKPPQ